VSLTIYKRATVIHSTGAGSLSTLRVVYIWNKLTNYVIRAKSAAKAKTEFVIR
jgi:hypothetical protein